MDLGKYDIRNDKLWNKETRKFVEDDVLGFVIISTDKNAAAGIHRYSEICRNEKHNEEVQRIAFKFNDWLEANPDRVKEPDGLQI